MHNKVREYWDKQYASQIVVNVIRKSDLFPCIAILNNIDGITTEMALDAKIINAKFAEGDVPVKIVNLFPNSASAATNNTNGKSSTTQLHCTGAQIIFKDKYVSENIVRVADIPPIKTIIDMLNDGCRYVNFSMDIVKAKRAAVLDGLSARIDNICGTFYSHHKVLYYKLIDRSFLLDVISVSFYKLNEIISIFNSTKSEGIVMEITLLNSMTDWHVMVNNGYYFTTRIAFSKYKDNLFVVDGEMLNFAKGTSVSSVLDVITNEMQRNSPDDSYIKNYKEMIVCAE